MMLMPSGFAKEEKFVFSAMKASDCSQVYRDWLPGECLRYSSHCRLNLSQRAGKSIFVIKKELAIAVFLAALHVGNLSYRQTGRAAVYSLFWLGRMLQHFLQKRCKALSYLDLLEKRTVSFENFKKPDRSRASAQKAAESAKTGDPRLEIDCFIRIFAYQSILILLTSYLEPP